MPLYTFISLLACWLPIRKLDQQAQAGRQARPAWPGPCRCNPPRRKQPGNPPAGWVDSSNWSRHNSSETDQKLERQYDDDYEQESFDLPPVIGAGAPATPPLVGTTREAFRDTPLTNQLREAEQASVTRKTAPARSPVYDSPIYTGNIARRIASDIQIARQAVVASIILGQRQGPLRSPEQVTRH